jgi:hypothetical protein
VALETDDQIVDAQAADAPSQPSAPVSDRDSMAVQLEEMRARNRDALGRFAEEKAAKEAGGQTPVETKPATPTAPISQRPDDMPRGWKTDNAALWSQVSPEARAIIAERERQMDEGFKRYEGLAKYADDLEAQGSNLATYVNNIAAIERAIENDEVLGTIQTLQAIGKDPARVAQGVLRALGIAANLIDQGDPQQAQQQYEAAHAQLLQRLEQLEKQNQQFASFTRSQNIAKSEQDVQAFLSDPSNPYAAEALDAIIDEVKTMRAAGQQPDLKSAYERAIWVNPDLRAKVIADQNRRDQEARAASASKAAAAAKSASRSVAGSPLPGGASSAYDGKSNHELMQARLAELRATTRA